MKKVCAWFLIMALALACSAFAESADIIDRFSDTWVADGFSAEIWYDDEADCFKCEMALIDGSFCDYENCRYDADADAMVCEGGVRYNAIFNEDTGDYDKEVLAEGLAATFTEADDKLTCENTEGMLKGIEFLHLYDAEELYGETTSDPVDADALSGRKYAGLDPWGNPLAVTLDAVNDGKLNWTYTEDFDGQVLFQSFEDVALVDGLAAFHVEGAVQDAEGATLDHITCDYSGTIRVEGDAVAVTFTAGEMTESSPEGGSTAYHVAALEEADRTVTLIIVE